MGANTDAASQLARARLWLDAHFGGITYGDELRIAPERNPLCEAPYHNQCAILTTTLSLADLHKTIKQAEAQLGRTAEDKARGIVRIDIDIIAYGQEIVKPQDLTTDYLHRCLASLPTEHTNFIKHIQT